MELPVYLDYQATTPLDERVLDSMLPFLQEKFGNPHSVHHVYGWRAKQAVASAREQIAALIGGRPDEIVFSSGATESNNLAILGVAGLFESGHFISCATEHRCVLQCLEQVRKRGFEATVLPVQADGLIDIERLKRTIRDDTRLVSIMGVNNEVGVIQDLTRVGELCAERGICFHSDAAQALGKIPIDVERMHIDLLSVSGHKIYGPMGIGALYVRADRDLRLQPQIHGGGQERGMRSGTLAVPLCVGLGEACAISGREMTAEAGRIAALRAALVDSLTARLADVRLNGHPTQRVPGNLSLSFPGVDAEALIDECEEIAISTASACTSASPGPSHVLKALGLPDEIAHSSVRIGIGRFTSETEIRIAADCIVQAVRKLGK